MTANDAWSSKLKDIRKVCQTIELKKLTPEIIASRLKNICKTESFEFEEAAIKKLALSVDGDLRAAINDLDDFPLVTDGLISKDQLQPYSAA